MHSGVVIAGGRSTRFGDSDKAIADLAGKPMIRRVVDRVVPVVDDLVVNCRRDQVDAIEGALDGCGLDPTFAIDETPDEGPMAGIERGLGAAKGEYAVVVACDMPFVETEFVSYLFERAEDHDAAVPKPDEWFQTTQAVYRTAPMRDACRRALGRGDRKIVDALFEIDYVVVSSSEITTRADPRTFENLNTRTEFEAAADRL